MRRDQSGFTLVELLLAAALLLVVLGVMASFLLSSQRAYAVTARVTKAEDQLDLITQLLDYDFRLAGYMQDGSSEVISIDPDLSGAEILYYENRFGEDVEKAVRYEVDEKAQLSRTEKQAGTTLKQVLSADTKIAFKLEPLDAPHTAITIEAVVAGDEPRMIVVPLVSLTAGGH